MHTEVYSELVKVYVDDLGERTKIYNAFKTNPAVKKKIDWMKKWMNRDTATFAERAIAFAAIEGLFFSGSFAIIFWLKSKNLLPGLAQANEFISRDEGMHTKFTCLLYSMIENKPDRETVNKIIDDAVDVEIEFQKEVLAKPNLGLNINTMSKYIKFVADFLLEELGYSRVYKTGNPFPFMQNLATHDKTNFFERQNTAYQSGNNTGFKLVKDF